MTLTGSQLVIRHAFVLAASMVLVVALALITISLTAAQDQLGEVINLSGKQRMLSQRAMLYADQFLELPSDEVRERYQGVLDTMTTDMERLRAISQENYARELYDESSPLMSAEADYLQDHRRMLANPSKKLLGAMFIQQERLLPLLDDAVSEHERQLKNQLEGLVTWQTGVFLVFILVLIIDATLVFFPIYRVLKHRQLERGSFGSLLEDLPASAIAGAGIIAYQRFAEKLTVNDVVRRLFELPSAEYAHVSSRDVTLRMPALNFRELEARLNELDSVGAPPILIIEGDISRSRGALAVRVEVRAKFKNGVIDSLMAMIVELKP